MVYEVKEPPGHSRGLLLVQQGCCLPAGLEAGSATRAAVRAAAKDVPGGDKLDPKRTVAFVIRGGTGLAKCTHAALLRTRCCGGETLPSKLVYFEMLMDSALALLTRALRIVFLKGWVDNIKSMQPWKAKMTLFEHATRTRSTALFR